MAWWRREGSSGCAGEVKGRCYVFRQPSQAGCGGAVVLLAPELQEQNSGCVAQLFHCGSVVGSCYVASQVLSGNKELKTT